MISTQTHVKDLSSGTWTHDLQRSRLKLYQLSYQGSSVGWVQISHTNQHKARPGKCFNRCNVHVHVHVCNLPYIYIEYTMIVHFVLNISPHMHAHCIDFFVYIHIMCLCVNLCACRVDSCINMTSTLRSSLSATAPLETGLQLGQSSLQCVFTCIVAWLK